MRKQQRILRSRKQTYSEQQLVGLRTHAQVQKQNTVERLEAAIASLNTQSKPISARTIREECGLEYTSIRRNPEALLLYQQNSAYLKQRRKRVREPLPDAPKPRDPLLAYRKKELVARVHKAEELLQAQEQQHNILFQDYIQKDIKIAELEAELARYRQYLDSLRLAIQQQEHGS